jgi:hypothetical protein
MALHRCRSCVLVNMLLALFQISGGREFEAGQSQAGVSQFRGPLPHRGDGEALTPRAAKPAHEEVHLRNRCSLPTRSTHFRVSGFPSYGAAFDRPGCRWPMLIRCNFNLLHRRSTWARSVWGSSYSRRARSPRSTPCVAKKLADGKSVVKQIDPLSKSSGQDSQLIAMPVCIHQEGRRSVRWDSPLGQLLCAQQHGVDDGNPVRRSRGTT